MKKIIFNKGFGYLILIIVAIGLSLIPMVAVKNEMKEVENKDDIPLQNAVVEENKEEEPKVEKPKQEEKKNENIKKENKKNTQKKKTTKKTNKVVNKQKKSTPRKVSTPKASSNEYQNYAHNLVINQYGWSEYDFQCLVKLWNRESGWNPNAHNKSSGAHGIPQSLPASKMKSEGTDYYTNGYTQIRWGLKYIKGRYGSPSKAWQHSQKKGWY